MTSVELNTKPVIRQGFRLQWEAAQNCHVLLYPEGMVKLNRSGGEILSRCDGSLTTQQIVLDLERSFSRTDLSDDVLHFIAHAIDQGWIA